MKKYLKIIISLVATLIIIGAITISNAVEPTYEDIDALIKNNPSINPENITSDDIVVIYEELSDKYTNEEMAQALQQNSSELKKSGIDQETIDLCTSILQTTDDEDLKEIIKNTDFNEIKAEIENSKKADASGNTTTDVMPTKTLKFMLQVFWASKAVKAALIASIVIAVYMIIVRWVIYRKAGKHGWAAIIPIYRDVVWLKIAGISPWVLLLVLLPVIGWLILGIIFIISKFTLPKRFGRSAGWGLGLLILPIIFESVVAFSSGFKYKGDK